MNKAVADWLDKEEDVENESNEEAKKTCYEIASALEDLAKLFIELGQEVG